MNRSEKNGPAESAVSMRQMRRTETTTRQIALLIERLVSELIDDGQSCEVKLTQAGSLLLIEVIPNGARTAGQLIGKQGRTIAAIRTLATAVCAKYGWRAQLEIVA
jgi:predicted RNA-binding protein YlqC (UPF0109 family)